MEPQPQADLNDDGKHKLKIMCMMVGMSGMVLISGMLTMSVYLS